LSAQLSLNKINSELGDSRLKLSTGKRINSAEDDSAGYAIATKLNSRVKGLEQALQNVSDAKSMLDVVEGAYTSIIDNLIELKRLANHAANETVSTGSDEMALIASQMEAIGDDINDIAQITTFNSVNLIGTSANNTLVFQVGEIITDTMNLTLDEISMRTLFIPNTLINPDANQPDAEEVLGDKIEGGTPEAVNPPVGEGEQHLFKAYDWDLNPSVINTLQGASILVRGRESYPSTNINAKLFIDELTVNAADMRSFMGHIDAAIETMNSKVNELGINQRSLSSKEENLTQAITANSAAHSRIMDTDFAKEQSNSIRLQILQQTATAALSQANMGPQAVLGFLGQ
jgi:flagellin